MSLFFRPSIFYLCAQVEQLTALSFSRIDCKEALQQAVNQLVEAALWLTQHARPERLSVSPALEETSFLPGSSVSFSTIQVKTSCISLVEIDDYRDSDCPSLSSAPPSAPQTAARLLRVSQLQALCLILQQRAVSLGALHGALGLHN